MTAVFARAGVSIRAFRVVTFVHEWARCEAELGERVGIERFATWSSDSRATVHRRQADFRAMFPEFTTPRDMIVWPHGVPALADVELLDWTAVLA